MKSFVNIFKTLLFISLWVFIASCEDKVDTSLTGTITGKVIDKDNFEPLEGARITTNPYSDVVETDSLGTFTLEEVPEGEYNVIAAIGGYRSESVEIFVEFNETTDVELIMQRTYSAADVPDFTDRFFPGDKETVNTINITFSWQLKNPHVDSTVFDLILYRAGSSNNPSVFENLTDTFLLVNDLDFQTYYYWQLKANNDAGNTYTEVRQFKTPSFPENRILFSRITDGTSHLFITDTLEESTPMQITHNQHHNWNAKINPQRTSIAFQSSRDLNPALYVMDTDGANIKKITNFTLGGYFHQKIEFDWNPSGSQIIFTSYNKLYRINATGTGLETLATAPESKHFREVAFAPDGNTIYTIVAGSLANDRQVYSLSPNGDNLQLVYDNNEFQLAHLDVHPDNNRLLFSIDISGYISDSGRMLSASIHEYNLTSGELVNISEGKPDGTNDVMASYSPDGGRIIFVNSFNTTNAIPSIYIYDNFQNSETNNRKELLPEASYPFWFE